MLKGKCQCGAVQYQVDGDLVEFSHCHCSICRRLHGAAFATFVGAKSGDFQVLQGQDNIKRYGFSENSDSAFCTTCGSRLFVEYKPDMSTLYIAAGTLEGDVDTSEGFHAFVGSKAPWFEITDDLPQFQGEWVEES